VRRDRHRHRLAPDPLLIVDALTEGRTGPSRVTANAASRAHARRATLLAAAAAGERRHRDGLDLARRLDPPPYPKSAITRGG
jgi:hypothetical protein